MKRRHKLATLFAFSMTKMMMRTKKTIIKTKAKTKTNTKTNTNTKTDTKTNTKTNTKTTTKTTTNTKMKKRMMTDVKFLLFAQSAASKVLL